jgi:hypothetical protein
VVRVSNVYGITMPTQTFLGQVLHEGRATGEVLFQQGAASAKDYISVATVVRMLPAVAVRGRQRIYNLATGSNTSHATIANRLHEIAGWRTSFQANAPTLRYLPIDTARLDDEFGSTSSNLSADLPTLLSLEQERQCSPSMKHAAA